MHPRWSALLCVAFLPSIPAMETAATSPFVTPDAARHQMKLTLQQLEAHMWGAANILRGKTAGQDYKKLQRTAFGAGRMVPRNESVRRGHAFGKFRNAGYRTSR